ncbi:neutral zinc metallopeptidase [Enemella sp. A6]|uniref:neutral zinc metallopeptidase n=1 Tax=Enemella sp. A6 TaxID=3440152 RepID=UPI003EC13C37
MTNSNWSQQAPQPPGNRQPAWQGGPQWQQPAQTAGWHQHGGWHQQSGWQQPDHGWQQQGDWHQQPSGPTKGPQKKILGILLGVCLAGLLVFVAVLLFSNRGPGYDYDDYESPPISDTAPDKLTVPGSEEEAWEILRNNPAYAGTAPDNVDCGIGIIDHEGLSPEELEARLNEMSACLMMVWDRPMTEQGITMFRPRVTVYTADITMACGTKPGDEPNAFYCGSDQMIYYNPLMHTHPETKFVGDTPLGVEVIMAHEFAHFLQGRSGIIAAFFWLSGPAPEDVQLEMTRRSEAQADCWSGQWVRANIRAMGIDEAGVEKILRLYHGIGDDSLTGDPDIVGNHGLGKTRRAWATTGMNSADVGACNSWVAPKEKVR